MTAPGKARMTDAAYIREHYAYDEGTGALYHKGGHRDGQQVGRPDEDGYLRTSFRGKHQRVHRLAWLYVHGVWPEIIDHLNHDKADNRIANLRSVSRLENQRNRALSKNNTSGVSGVRRDGPRGWAASIKIKGKRIHLGHFPSMDEAVIARRDAEVRLGFHPNHGRAACAS